MAPQCWFLFLCSFSILDQAGSNQSRFPTFRCIIRKCAPSWSFSFFSVRSWLSRCDIFIENFLYCGFSPTILRCQRDLHCYLSDGTLHISADMVSLIYTYLYLYFILIMHRIVSHYLLQFLDRTIFGSISQTSPIFDLFAYSLIRRSHDDLFAFSAIDTHYWHYYSFLF